MAFVPNGSALGDMVVMFGGDGLGGAGCDAAGDEMCDGTWGYHAGGWTLLQAGAGPSPRRDAAMARFGETVLLFGGATSPTSPCPDFAVPGPNGCIFYDLWQGRFVADAWQWTQLGPDPAYANTEPDPAVWPSRRFEHAMAYDAIRDRLVLFGGCVDVADNQGCEEADSASLNDTWQWDGSAWTQLDLATSPSARNSHAMSYDSVRGRTLLFGGGLGDGRETSEAWEFDGTEWREITADSGTLPGSRRRHAISHDAERHRLLLAGGGASGEIWEWDLDPLSRPSAVFDYAWSEARVDKLAAVTASVTVKATATGYDTDTDASDLTGDPQTGLLIQGWDADAAAWAALPGCSDGTCLIDDAAQVQRFIFNGTAHFYVRLLPVAGMGNGLGPAQIEVDYGELTLGYELTLP
jgi:hypothetical protein